MNLLALILIILLLFGGLGTLPNWGYHDLGYGPSGGLGLVLIVILILLVLGRL